MSIPFTEIDTRVAVYGLATRDGERGRELLLTRWNGPDGARWTLPGGGVEYPEGLLEALHREFAEETGLTIDVGPLAEVDQWYLTEPRLDGSPRPLRGLRIVWHVTVGQGEARVVEVDGSTDEVRWWPLADVVNLPRVELVDVGVRALERSPVG